MKQKEITLCGKQIIIAYCFATEIAFSKYTGVGFDKFDPANPEHVIYTILASTLSYYDAEKQEMPVKDTDLMYHATPTELTNALMEIFELRKAWYEIPAGAEKKDEHPADEEGQEKNA